MEGFVEQCQDQLMCCSPSPCVLHCSLLATFYARVRVNRTSRQTVEASSRTPEGQPNHCPVCGKDLRIDPSRPPGDAPCPYCGSLLWFDSWYEQGPIEDTPGQIRLEFRGGCKDRIVFDSPPRFLVETRGYRYYRLAKTAQLGTRFHDVPFSEYDKIRHALIEHGCDGERTVQDLSRTDVEQIVQKLQDILVHVYEVIKKTEASDMIEVHLRFVEEARGL